MLARIGLLLALLLVGLQPAAAKRIAFSFDDAPRRAGAFLTPDQRTVRLIAALQRAGVGQAVFFVNPGNLAEPFGEGGEERLRAYVAAGHLLANHSFSHPALRATDADVYLADIDRAATWLSARPGYRPWFRFPFLDEGRADKAKRDRVRAGLAARGLTNGYVTVDASDWNMEQLTIDAVAAGTAIDMDGLRTLYVDSHVEAAEAADAVAVAALGRSPAHMMLLHETDLAAMFLPDMVAALKARGWEVIGADEAYRDPISSWAASVDVPSAQGTLIEAIAWARGLPEPRWWPGNQPDVALRRYRTEVLHAAP
ncbi:peptidoglycan/xylan/chitin deacetylase (PgdA/CDA1 family) [Sphingomonas jejuensis]|uniref:Chitooligosaccharide deacetylase n=1 Tax=Sphingomonas jejuensis TaxID=904715 RepID=A0ABX0XKV1_9SPHN|nr:polysaccharide deacetylase family protein [Sphingomonas jejuensis]NJC33406.1 peptidoglycan/xylan/chitin deacetylase (PgdA/CDA1 family) [Sphingomonas jejuensis]